MTFVNIAVAISALAGGGAKTVSETRRHFSMIFGCLSARGYWNGLEFWVILVAFRQWKNGQKWKNIVHSKILQGFWMPEHWKQCKNKCFGLTLSQKTCKLPYAWLETLQKHCQKQCFGRIYCLYGKKRVNYRLFDSKHWKSTVKNNVLEGFLIETS